MRRKSSRVVYALFTVGILLAVSLTCVPAGMVKADDTVTLRGTVNDNSGSPFAGADVQAIDASTKEVAQSSLTGSNGGYSMSVLPGTYDVKVIPPAESGFGTATSSGQVLTSDKTLDFVLVPAGSAALSGKLTDALGNGLPDQKVMLAPAGTGNYFITCVTDSSGGFFLEATPGEFDLRISSDNSDLSLNIPTEYSLDSEKRFSITESMTMNIALPLKRVSVHVQDQTGEPVAGALLYTKQVIMQFGLQLGTIPFYGRSVYDDEDNTVSTDSSGDTTMWLFPTNTGSYSLFADPPSGSSLAAAAVTDVSFTEDTALDIELGPPVILSGRVLDALGNGVSGHTISLEPVGTYYCEIPCVTDSSGNYSIGVSPGEYNLYLKGYTYDESLNLPTLYRIYGEEPISINEDISMDLTLPLKRVSVHVQDQAGNPVQGVMIDSDFISQQGLALGTLTVRGDSTYERTAPTDSSGNTTMWLFPSNTGPYTLNATPPSESGLAPGSVSSVSFTEDTTVNIELGSPVVLSGRVLDALGNGIPGQHVSLRLNGTSNFDTYCVTGSSGNYSIGVSPGEYYLRIYGYNSTLFLNIPPYFYIFSDEPVSINENKIMDMTLPLKRVNVHVQDQAGNPVQGVAMNSSSASQYSLALGDLLVHGVSSYSSFYTQVSTDSSGDVTMWLFPTNTKPYTLSATPPSGSPYANFTVNNATVSSDETIIIALQFLHDPPVTTAVLDPEPDEEGICAGPATVTLQAAAAEGFSVESTFYSVDNGEEQVYSGPFVVAGGGGHSVEFWSVDNVGVYETQKTLCFEVVSNRAPSADAGSNQELEATCPRGAEAILDGSGSSDPDGDELVYTWAGGFGTAEGASPSVTLPLGDNNITLTVSDGLLESSDTVAVTVSDTTPPDLIVPDDVTVTATGETTPVSLAGAAAADLVDGNVAVTDDAPATYPLGTTIVTFTATDSHGNTATGTTKVTVTDTGLPVVEVSGVADGESYTDGAAADVVISDGESGIASQTITLDGDTYLPGTGITAKGEHTFIATASDYAGNTTTVTIVFNVYHSTFMTLTATPCQYSDGTALCATLTSNEGTVSGREIAFEVDGAETGAAATGENGTATLNSAITLPSGAYPAVAQFAQDDAGHLRASQGTAQLDVVKETAQISYTGDYLRKTNESVVLSAQICEEADGATGRIENAGGIAFEIYNPQGMLVREISAEITEENPGIGLATATISSLPANLYTVKARLSENSYYQADSQSSSQLVIYNPSAGCITGSGYLWDYGLKTFGFCVKPSCVEPWLPSGNLLFVDYANICHPLAIKSTGFTWLVVPDDENIAYVAGTCSLNCTGGYYFYLTVRDLCCFPCNRLDAIHLKVTDAGGSVIYEKQGAIDGGNIVICD